MAVNITRVSNIVRLVDTFIELRGFQNDITTERVESLLDEAKALAGGDIKEEEIEAARRDITYKYQIYTTPGQSILLDYNEEKWYDLRKPDINPFFWQRYKDYLIDVKKFSPNVVSTLGEETLDQKLMNYLGDPKSNDNFFRRGLIIGDVQSGKTSTYIGLMCKAADAGYKVFILLTGTIESLRKQTQERVEEGFTGVNPIAEANNKRVGVGLDNKPIHATVLTSRFSDFTGNTDKIAMALASNDAVVFVIKKNSTVLSNLKEWLISMNADPVTQKIDLPVLLIDDEADNASINTSKEKESPTTINRMIRELASVFTKSNYIGFTATPFANVFIDPETTEGMENSDLFPENFIVALPTPSNYIGPMDIFPDSGKYHSQIKYIEDAGVEEDDGWPFYYKHKKDWEGTLPNSLTDALFCFYIVNAIRDLRGDRKEHRSMLINMSRFVKVQYRIKEQVEQLHERAYRSIKFNLSKDKEESLMDPIIRRIHKDFMDSYSDCEFTWEEIADVLYSSIENIQIKVVNSSKSSEKLEYPKNESMRVIAIGGLALSRGLTLEGLIISYFYRNTCTYDVLMQMGRWFGYRRNYDDLFRIWTDAESVKWYAEIAESSEILKRDMEIMREKEMKPRNFGIRVRNNCDKLRITAPNKMRNATDEYEFESYFGGIVETPYLILDPKVQIANFNAVKTWTENHITAGKRFKLCKVSGGGEHNVMFDISKSEIIDLLRSMQFSRFNPNFDVEQIIDFLSVTETDVLDSWNVAYMDGRKTDNKEDIVQIGKYKIYKLKRYYCKFSTQQQRLSLGNSGKLGGTSDGLFGIEDFGGKSAESIIEEAKLLYNKDNEGTSYQSNTWFRYIKDRKPLMIVYLVDVDTKDNQKKPRDDFKNAMNGIPVVGLALGFPRNDTVAPITKNKYKANKVYNWFEKDSILTESEEEE